jgi:ubiquinone/menaquinone biosynthesis C-methylase UbiE
MMNRALTVPRESMPAPTIQADFDRIALISADGWSHNSHYHGFLLGQLPARCQHALDVGCGTGAFSRLLAARCDQVFAIDLSPQMIEIAKKRSTAHDNLTFQVADVMSWEFGVEQFDCIASIATLHHLPLDEMLVKIRTALSANGVFVALDLYQPTRVSAVLMGLLAIPTSLVLRRLKTGQWRESHQVRQVWVEHSRHDSFPTLAYIRQVCASALPGSQVRRHLLWRYSIAWTKPAPNTQGSTQTKGGQA